jgi:hypothetical protein
VGAVECPLVKFCTLAQMLRVNGKHYRAHLQGKLNQDEYPYVMWVVQDLLLISAGCRTWQCVLYNGKQRFAHLQGNRCAEPISVADACSELFG